MPPELPPCLVSLELDAKPQCHPGHGFADESIVGSIGFLITGDEEGPAINGTEKLLRWAYENGERFDHCIVGEPTSFEAEYIKADAGLSGNRHTSVIRFG